MTPSRAEHDLSIPFGAVVFDASGVWRYVFVGWAALSYGMHEAVMIREMQPGERLTPSTPWTYHCSTTETLLRRFPELERYRTKK